MRIPRSSGGASSRRGPRSGGSPARIVALLRAPLRTMAAALGLAWAAGPVAACGLCAEDKVAATYDAAVVAGAAARHHLLMFAALEGPVAGTRPRLAVLIKRALERAPGVDPGTVRVSLDPPAASCAWDPGRASRARLLGAANRSLASIGVRLRPLDPVVLPPLPLREAQASR